MKFVYKNDFGVDLPDIFCSDRDASSSDVILRAMSDDDRFGSKADPEPGDIVVFKTGAGSYENHLGIYVGRGRFLHCNERYGTSISRMDHGYWKRCYRYAVSIDV